MAQLTPTIQFSLNGSWTTIADVLTAEGLECLRGRTYVGPGAVVAEPGTATLWLDNSSSNSGGLAGYYSPFHPSCRAGFGLRTRVRVLLSSPSNPSGVEIWAGRIADIIVEPGERLSRRVRVLVEDWVANLARTTVRGVSLQTTQRADQLIATLFSNTDDPDYNVAYTLTNATGVSTFGYALDYQDGDEPTLLEELRAIEQSERGRMYLRAGSVLAFESANTWAETDIAYTFDDDMSGLGLQTVSDDLINRVNVHFYPVKIDTSDVVLYSLGSSTLLVQPGETNTSVFGPFRDPDDPGTLIGGTSFASVTATTDYTMNSAADGSGSNLTANFTVSASTTSRGVSWTITNGGATAGYVTLLQLRGRGVYRSRTTIVRALSSATYGAREVNLEMPYQSNIAYVEYYADQYAAQFSRPGQPRAASVTFCASRSDALADAAVTIDQGDRIALSETMTGLASREYIVTGQKWDIRERGVVWMTWYLEAVATTQWITPVYSSATYTASGSMTWTVESADVVTYRYLLNGDTLVLSFDIQNSTIGGTPSTELRIGLPESLTVTTTTGALCSIRDGGTWATGILDAVDGDTFIRILRVNVANWSTATNTVNVRGQVYLEVE